MAAMVVEPNSSRFVSKTISQSLSASQTTVFVGIRQGRAARCTGDPHMHESPEAEPQTVADLAQGIGASQLAEQHRNEPVQQVKPLAGRSAPCFFTRAANSRPREVLEQLIEQAW